MIEPGLSSSEAIAQRLREDEAATLPDAIANIEGRLRELRANASSLDDALAVTDRMADALAGLVAHLRTPPPQEDAI